MAVISTQNSEDNSTLEKLKLEDLKLSEKITEKNNEYIKCTENLASLEAEKLVTLERKKYELKDEAIKEVSIKLKEEELSLQKDLASEQAKLKDLIEDIKASSIEKDNIDNLLITEKVKKNTLNNKINEYQKNIFHLENTIEILEDNINNNSKMPNAVRSVLNNMRLEGVHNIIGNLIETESDYSTAITTALGASSNFLVVEDETSAKECINFLKENKLGRATFFPLNIIKEKNVNSDDLALIIRVLLILPVIL